MQNFKFLAHLEVCKYLYQSIHNIAVHVPSVSICLVVVSTCSDNFIVAEVQQQIVAVHLIAGQLCMLNMFISPLGEGGSDVNVG